MKVLIVDEARDERARLVEALSSATDVVVVGAVGRLHSALHALGDYPPEVIITDNQLGDDHAVHLIAAARRTALPPAIVVFSSIDTVEERRRCIEAGADRFIPKAAGVAALQRAILDVHVQRWRPTEHYQLLGRLAEGAAHDLDNYLGVIDVSLGMMKKRLAGQPVTDEVTSLRRALEEAIRVTSRMTRYTKPASPRGPVDLSMIIRRVLELFGKQIPLPVALHDDSLRAVPLVDGVELDLEQRVLALILEVCDASDDWDSVTVRLTAPDAKTVRLAITTETNARTVDFPV